MQAVHKKNWVTEPTQIWNIQINAGRVVIRMFNWLSPKAEVQFGLLLNTRTPNSCILWTLSLSLSSSLALSLSSNVQLAEARPLDKGRLVTPSNQRADTWTKRSELRSITNPGLGLWVLLTVKIIDPKLLCVLPFSKANQTESVLLIHEIGFLG